ncbi:MAG: protein-glutamate O-methyltransferase CheR [Planctomyces sp.]|nr:protein-glutamate O-methyltransferase CheR [Planctomyces sp.]
MPLAAPDVEYLKTVIAERSGNVISSNQDYLLESRLSPVAKTMGLDNVEKLVAELRRRPASQLHDRVAEAMTINETSFFRDIAPFDAMRTDILPELIRRRASSKSLSIWCGASSSGQEPYTIAMLIREHFNELAGWNVRILATDISDEMVKRTQDGLYSQFEVNRGLPAPMLIRHFERKGTQWQAKPELRRMIDAKKLNLTTPWPAIAQFDIVFLRNVLIYFDTTAKSKILTRIHKSLRPDGYLFLGGGETLITLNVPFVRESVGKTVCFRPVTA